MWLPSFLLATPSFFLATPSFFLATPSFFLRYRRIVITLSILLLCGTAFHIYQYQYQIRSQPTQPRPDPVQLDGPFYTGCQNTSYFEAQPRENATILMLARNSDVEGAVKSLESLEESFNSWAKYPVVFLNDEVWEQGFMDAVREVVSGEVEFGVIAEEMWGFPEFINEQDAFASMAAQGKAGVLYGNMTSYHHMCRFNSGLFYDHPLLQKYKYYWRVEPNVRFTCRITYDPFAAMSAHGKLYGFIMALWEIPDTAPSLFRTVSKYKSVADLPDTPLWCALTTESTLPWPLNWLFLGHRAHHNPAGTSWNLCHFWSNFEIASLDFFRSEPYRNLFSYLDHQGGFYFERWGDAPVHSLAAALLLDSSQLHHFADFGYVHEPFQYCPFETEPGSGVIADMAVVPESEAAGLGCQCVCDDTLIPRPVCLNTIKEVL